jgi:hypothetical protein
MRARTLRYVISAAAVGLAVAHIIWPGLSIDGIALGLLAIAVIPWLSPLFKSIELPGGMKIEYQELEKAGESASNAGLVAPNVPPTTPPLAPRARYAFEDAVALDPNMALAGLRIEIERRLKELANASGGLPRIGGSGALLHTLRDREVLSGEAFGALRDITALLNTAVHGAIVTPRAVNWVMDIGPGLLEQLDKVLEETRHRQVA